MRQVPHYLLIGNGRVARHFQHYFSLLHITFSTWQRTQSIAELQQHLATCSHILILITDREIERFIQMHLQHTSAYRLHFSGSLVSEHAYGVHPLMCFNENLYELAQYQTIPFILDHHAPDFSTLFPGLSNPHMRLQTSLKAKYHALCVLSGNFSCLLWQKLFFSFEQEFNLDPTFIFPYLFQQTQNLHQQPKTALTGPLTRNDHETIQKNLLALHGDAFHDVYASFVDCYTNMQREIK